MGSLMEEAEKRLSETEASQKELSQKEVSEKAVSVSENGVSEKGLSTHVKLNLNAMTVDQKLELIKELKRARRGEFYYNIHMGGGGRLGDPMAGMIVLYIFILYAIYQFFFRDTRPNKLFKRASRQCVGDPRVKNMLGEPIKAFGEDSMERKITGLVSLLFCFWRFLLGWKKEKVSFFEYKDMDGRGGWRKAIRVMFYLQGPTDSIGV